MDFEDDIEVEEESPDINKEFFQHLFMIMLKLKCYGVSEEMLDVVIRELDMIVIFFNKKFEDIVSRIELSENAKELIECEVIKLKRLTAECSKFNSKKKRKTLTESDCSYVKPVDIFLEPNEQSKASS